MQPVDNNKEPFQFKAHKQTMMVLYLLSPSEEDFFTLFSERLKRAKTFFAKAPIVVDVSGFEGAEDLQVIGGIFVLLQAAGLCPVGLQGVSEDNKKAIIDAGFVVLPNAELEHGKEEMINLREPAVIEEQVLTPAIEEKVEPEVIIEKVTIPAAPALIIDQPVRSGQRIKTDGDIICMASISEGAELAAKGNIHVYGVLRGRAFAGIGGDKNARIFCNKLDAQLVSIAGVYRLCENFEDAFINNPTSISLHRESLQFKLI